MCRWSGGIAREGIGITGGGRRSVHSIGTQIRERAVAITVSRMSTREYRLTKSAHFCPGYMLTARRAAALAWCVKRPGVTD